MGDTVTHYVGDDRSLIISVEDDDGNPVNIDGAQQITFKIAALPNGEPIISKDLDDGIEILVVSGEDPWEFEVDITGADMALVPTVRVADYFYEARVVDSTGEVATVITGTFRFLNTMEA
jgi:hypothetical protein